MTTSPRRQRFVVGSIRWTAFELGTPSPTYPTAVLVAGLGSGDYLLPHAERVAESRQVLVPDMPGFGGSRARRRLRSVDEFADALLAMMHARLDLPADVVGNSFGTQIVLAAAARDRGAIRRVVLIGPTFDAAARRPLQVLLRWFAIVPYEPPALAVSLLRSYAKCGVRTPLYALLAGLRDAPESRIADVRQPLLLVRGKRDRIAPQRWLEELRDRAPDARVAEVAQAAHTVDFAKPEQAAALTSSFFVPLGHDAGPRSSAVLSTVDGE